MVGFVVPDVGLLRVDPDGHCRGEQGAQGFDAFEVGGDGHGAGAEAGASFVKLLYRLGTLREGVSGDVVAERVDRQQEEVALAEGGLEEAGHDVTT